MTITLTIEARESKGKSLKAHRAAGKMPGIVYGPKQEATPIMLDKKVFDKVLKEAGESTILTLQGLKEDIEVLIHEVAFDAERGGVEHVDFYAIERGKALTTNVPLQYVGEAPVEKAGAVVNKVLHDVEVTCRPSDLPGHLEIDLSVLTDMDSQISISDIKLPDGVVIENDAQDIVANVSAVEEEVEEEVETVDMDAIEVEAKGKAEEATEEAPSE